MNTTRVSRRSQNAIIVQSFVLAYCFPSKNSKVIVDVFDHLQDRG